MKTTLKQCLSLMVLCVLMLGTIQGCSKKTSSQPAQEPPAQKMNDANQNVDNANQEMDGTTQEMNDMNQDN